MAIPRGKINFSLQNFCKAIYLILSGQLLEGGYVRGFESAFSKYVGTRYAIAISSGRMGLYLALKALGAKSGDEVILPSYTIAEVPYIIMTMGLKPVFVDIDPDTYNINVRLIESRITGKTKFILLTHLYGQPCEIDEILKIANRYHLKTIEDAAQACGAEYKGQKVGSFADIAYFSFGLLKNLNTLGGGIITTNNELLYAKIAEEIQTYPFIKRSQLILRFIVASLASFCTSPLGFTLFSYPAVRLLNLFNKADILNRMFGLTDYEKVAIGKYKKKLANIQAAIGLDQLKKLDMISCWRVKNAEILSDSLKDVSRIKMPKSLPWVRNIYLNYVVRTEYREKIKAELIRNGIDVTQSFLNSCAHLKEFGKPDSSCIFSEQLVRDNLCLPVHPPLGEKHMRYMADKIRNIVEHKLA